MPEVVLFGGGTAPAEHCNQSQQTQAAPEGTYTHRDWFPVVPPDAVIDDTVGCREPDAGLSFKENASAPGQPTSLARTVQVALSTGEPR